MTASVRFGLSTDDVELDAFKVALSHGEQTPLALAVSLWSLTHIMGPHHGADPKNL